MGRVEMTGLAQVLAAPERVESLSALVEAHFDQTITLRLGGAAGRLDAQFLSHVRRSFLGALGKAGSVADGAITPCPWDPPSTFDVFAREQLRGPKGDGLPKPYVLDSFEDGRDVFLQLRVFGMANDWLMAASDGLILGLRHILPWEKVCAGGVPEILDRRVELWVPEDLGRGVTAVRIELRTPLDISGTQLRDDPHRLLTRLLRRVDAVARWSGVALTDAALSQANADIRAVEVALSGLRQAAAVSPARGRHERLRPSLLGTVIARGELGALLPLLALGTRCHMGKGAVEGFGAFDLVVL